MIDSLVLDASRTELNYYRETCIFDPWTLFAALGEIGRYLTSKGLYYKMVYDAHTLLSSRGYRDVRVSLVCTPRYWQCVLEPTIRDMVEKEKQQYLPYGGSDPESYEMFFFVRERSS